MLTENAHQVPGYVDVGDQGMNDARWFWNVAVLVTASGNGSVAMWDPSLGQPCVQQISSHSCCINMVAISPKDQFICIGGDDQNDQKLVLYQNVRQQLQLRDSFTDLMLSSDLFVRKQLGDRPQGAGQGRVPCTALLLAFFLSSGFCFVVVEGLMRIVSGDNVRL